MWCDGHGGKTGAPPSPLLELRDATAWHTSTRCRLNSVCVLQMMVWAPPERTHIARLGARWMVVAVHVMRAHLRQVNVTACDLQALLLNACSGRGSTQEQRRPTL
jgi:hypothetical protein